MDSGNLAVDPEVDEQIVYFAVCNPGRRHDGFVPVRKLTGIAVSLPHLAGIFQPAAQPSGLAPFHYPGKIRTFPEILTDTMACVATALAEDLFAAGEGQGVNFHSRDGCLDRP